MIRLALVAGACLPVSLYVSDILSKLNLVRLFIGIESMNGQNGGRRTGLHDDDMGV